MKVIFLDIDGPMLPLRAYPLGEKRFDPCAVAIVNRLLDTSSAYLVISSNWAIKGRAAMVDVLEGNGIPPIVLHEDWTTPRLPDEGSWSRGAQIARWLAAHPETTHWVAFDDEEIEHDNAILVTLEDGILSAHFHRAARLLGIEAKLID